MFGIYHMDRGAERTFITLNQLSASNVDWNTFNLNLTSARSAHRVGGLILNLNGAALRIRGRHASTSAVCRLTGSIFGAGVCVI